MLAAFYTEYSEGCINMGSRKLKIFLVLVCALQFFSISSVLSQVEKDNLVKNPGFEEGEPSQPHFWYSDSWDSKPGVTEFILDEDHFYSGSRSALIINNSKNDSRYKQVIKAKKDTYYRLSCWVKTEGVGNDFKGANISAEGLTKTSRDICGTSTDWEYLELYGRTIPSQESFSLTIGLGGHGNTNIGKVWIDNVEVVEFDSLPPGKSAINLDPNYTAPNNTNSSKNSTSYLVIVALLILACVLVFVLSLYFKGKTPWLNRFFRGNTPAISSDVKNKLPSRRGLKLDRTDLAIMGAMSLIYLCIALYNLGDLKVPVTSWEPSAPGESFTIDLGRDTNLSRIYYYSGLGSTKNAYSKLRVEYLKEDHSFGHLATIEKKNIFIWEYVDTPPISTSQLRFIIDASGGAFNEIAIVEEGSTVPIEGIRVIEHNLDQKAKDTLKNLFDEHDKFAFAPSYMNGMYFDEIYHARAAFEHIHNMEPSEITHPPLGKLFISLGILIFGMVPFGWRIIGTLFGVAMIPAMYVFGKRIFNDKFYAFCSAFLMMFDFMHFSQTRIATIDSYVTLFVILMYYYMYDYFIENSHLTDFKGSLKPLFLCGLFFGLGAASKWIAFYGAIGLALLFCINKISGYAKYKKHAKDSPIQNYYHNLVLSLGAGVLFFAVIPSITYILSYIPWIQASGGKKGLGLFWENSLYMLKFHSGLVSTHGYQSSWWEWPIMVKPMAFYFGKDLEPGMISKIFTMGNPAVWWIGLVALLVVCVWALSKLNKNLVILFSLAISCFGYVALPNSMIFSFLKVGNPELWWSLILLVLIAIVFLRSKIDTGLIITAVSSFLALFVVMQTLRGLLGRDDYLKDKNIQLIIWACLLISISILFMGLYKYDKKLMVIMSALIFQYIPWIAVPRIAFIYHYFSIVPFIILLIVYVIKKITDKYAKAKNFVYLYLGITFALFVLFYPGLSGLEVPASYMRALKWFPTWYF